jgi:Autographiviridae endonuclease VII
MSSKARRAGAAERSIWLGSTSEEHRVCIRCHIEQPITQFTLRGSRRELVCRKCRAQRQRAYRDSLSAERRTLDRHAMRGWRFGLSPNLVAGMLADQHGRCAICSVEMTNGRKGSDRACLDHDHQSGKPRAFLCGSCNSKLGHFETVLGFPESISAALAAYLEKFRSRPAPNDMDSMSAASNKQRSPT